MTINRNNYESYFLLYVDNELSAPDRIALDEFVRQNPDLQKELLMLMQTVMPGDRVSFDNKSSLIKEIEVVAIPEKLLLYADGELPYSELKEIEGLLLTDEVLAREWEKSPRTIQRDLDFIRDVWGLPLEYHRKKYGFYFSEPVGKFPMVPISERELVSVFVAQKALSQYRGTPFEKRVDTGAKLVTKTNLGEAEIRELVKPDLAKWLGE